MRYRRLSGTALVLWALGVAGALAASPVADWAWLVPVAVGSTAALAVRPLRTLAWVLPVAAVAGIDGTDGWPRMGSALVAVLASILAVGLLDGWADSRPDRTEAARSDPADTARWWSARRAALLSLGGWLLATAVAWVALGEVSWSTPGWLLAALPVAATLAVAAATWPLWRPHPAEPNPTTRRTRGTSGSRLAR